MTDDVPTLNEAQLELLFDFQNYILLQTFTESKNPSEVARELGVPANTMYYHVGQLEQAKLLRVTAQDESFRVHSV